METFTKFKAPDFILKKKTTIEMPRHAEVLSLHVENNELFMFAKVNTERQTEIRCFSWISSDEEIPNNYIRFVGTVFFGKAHQDKLAVHVIEVESIPF